MSLLVKKLSSNAQLPTRATSGSAGYDLYAAESYVVPSNGRQLVRTDIALLVPEGTYGRIASRSGIAWKHFIHVGAGVVDRDYRGNVCVLLFNFAKEDFKGNSLNLNVYKY